MSDLLTDELRATLHDRFGDVAATPSLYRRVQRRIALRRRVRSAAALATVVGAIAAFVFVPGLLSGDGLRIADHPGDVAGRPDATPAPEPTHALLTTQGGGLIAIDLVSGARTELVPDPEHAATVIDLTVAAGSSIEDFTAIAFDDGSGPIGFVTYVRRDGGEVRTSFTPNDGRFPGHGNRMPRTIAPDGRWLAYGSGDAEGGYGVGLVPIDPVSGELRTDDPVVIDGLRPPATWAGPVSEAGDRSLMLHHHPDINRVPATVLERTEEGFAIVEETSVDVAGIEDADGMAMRRVALASTLPGQVDDGRFDVVVEFAQADVGQLVPPDHAVVRYTGPDGGGEVRFELLVRAGNHHVDAQAGTALFTLPMPARGVDEPRDEWGAAWLVRSTRHDDGVTLVPEGPLVRGVVSGALLGPVRRGEPAGPEDGVPGAWTPPDDYTFVLASRCGERNDLGRYTIVVEDGRVTEVDAPHWERLGREWPVGFVSSYEGEAPTLPELIAEADAARSAGAEHVELTVDPEDGRPTRLDIDWDLGAIDDEACFIVSDYEPTSP